MTRHEFLQSYWSYYLMLEHKFNQTMHYVELHNDNHSAFSNEYASLLQSIGAELDAFFKVYCGFEPNARKSIDCYAECILGGYPEITAQGIIVNCNGSEITPFDGWSIAQAAQSLPWWTAFNNIKHSRADHKADASQLNVLNMLGALFLIEMKYLNKITEGTSEFDIPNEQSTLFRLKNWTYRYIAMKDIKTTVDGETFILNEDR